MAAFSFYSVFLTLAFNLAFPHDFVPGDVQPGSSSASAVRRKAETCSPVAGNLAVVNFSSVPLRVFVKGKSIGVAPAGDQKLFKRVLPPGSPLVEIKPRNSKASTAALMTQTLTVPAGAKKACATTRAIIVPFSGVAAF